MFAKKNVLFVLLIGVLSGCGGASQDAKKCGTKETCETDPNCECWCSVKCGFRKKNSSDNPIYIENDPNGKYCYCKQWDYDHYEDNCILKENIKEPEGAK